MTVTTPTAVVRTRPHSLRQRLLWLVLASIWLAAMVQGFSAYRGALQQADEMFDYHLQQMAYSLRGGIPLVPAHPGDADGLDLIVQIWGPDGAQLFRSDRIGLPPQAVLGFSDVAVGGSRYRVYSVQTPLQTIQIAQDLSARTARARTLAISATLPIALMAPLLMLAVGWIIRRSFAPVERIRRQVAERHSDDLSPLPETGLPEEISPLVGELNLLLQRIDQSFAAQKNFVADAAHELRSPLTALKLQAQSLRRSDDPAQQELALGRLNQGIDRAIHLLEQLLALARAESKDSAEALAPVDLRDIVSLAIADLLPLAQAKGLDLGVTALPEPGQAMVRGQAQALRILLRNLLDNAVKYTPAPGQVDVHLSVVNHTLHLAVEDSGPGIATEERDRVWDRFYRSQTTQNQGGSGLGLAIAQAIAQHHGMRCELRQSEKLGGLCVELICPTAPVQ